MRRAMQRHFAIFVVIGLSALRARHAAVDLARGVDRAFRRKKRGVQVECALYAVLLHQFDQVKILFHAVVIAQRKRLGLAAGKQHLKLLHGNAPPAIFVKLYDECTGT